MKRSPTIAYLQQRVEKAERFGSELERLQWLYEKAPKGQKEAAARKLRDYRTAMLRAEIEQRKAA